MDGKDPHQARTMISWNRDLENAGSVHEVVSTTRRFLATFSPRDLAALPEASVPREIVTDDDIREWSRRLSDEYWRQRALGGELATTQEMWSFFLRASIQLARIAQAHRSRAFGATEAA
jgi:hypothetical protein